MRSRRLRCYARYIRSCFVKETLSPLRRTFIPVDCKGPLVSLAPGLASCDLLGHVQQQLLVVGFHFREEPAQFGEVIGFAALAPEFVILRRFHLAQSCWDFTSMKQAVHRDFERACHLFKGLDRWNCMTVFNARDVASQKSCSLFDVAL